MTELAEPVGEYPDVPTRLIRPMNVGDDGSVRNVSELGAVWPIEAGAVE